MKRQVVILKEIRENISLKKGDGLTVYLSGDIIIMRIKPKGFSKYTLELHKELWWGIAS